VHSVWYGLDIGVAPPGQLDTSRVRHILSNSHVVAAVAADEMQRRTPAAAADANHRPRPSCLSQTVDADGWLPTDQYRP
jgi:hypothetical protein